MGTWEEDLRASGRGAAPLVVAAVLSVLALGLVPFGGHQLTQSPMALPVWLILVLVFDVMTLTVLVAQYRSGAGPRTLALTWAFIWSAVLTAAMLVVAQRAVERGAATAGEAQAVAWLYTLRHLGVPALVVLALTPWSEGVSRRMASPQGRTSRILQTHLVVAGSAVVLALVVVDQPGWLPGVVRMVDGVPMLSRGVAGAVLLANLALLGAGVAGLVARRGGHGLEAWAIVALVADCGDTLLTFVTQSSHTVAWYGARGLGLVGALAVLGALLREGNLLQIRTRRFAEQLAVQNVSLTEAQGMRDHLVAVVSHDMRSPLAGLLGYLELLEAVEDLRPEQVQQMHASCHRLTKRLILMTEDLLASATVDGLQVIPEELVLRGQVEECVAAFPELSVLVDCPADLQVRADPLRLQQVLTNLVRNAQKHGAEPVRIHATAIAGSMCRISVSDAGAGVDPAFVPRLFDRYSRGANATTHGSGLGLSVARSLTERHDGQIAYDASTNAFVVEIPAVAQRLKPGLSLPMKALTPSAKSGPV